MFTQTGIRRMRFSAGLLLFASQCFGQTVITVAGSTKCCASPDGGAATSAWLEGPEGLAFDAAGNLYIYETQRGRVRKVSRAGIITTAAGTGTPGGTGDGGPAIQAQLFPTSGNNGLAIDQAGNLYIADGNNQRIRKVDTSGNISTVAGSGAPGFSGDGGPATSAMLQYPRGIAVDSQGNLYIADASNYRVRRVDAATGIITTFAGNGDVTVSGDGGAATKASFGQPTGVTADILGNVYFSDGRRIYRVNAAGTLNIIAGTANFGFSGDGGPAVNARISGTQGMVVDGAGNLVFADSGNGRIRKIDAAGMISTIAGGGTSTGDGPALSVQIPIPHDVVLDASGSPYFSNSGAGGLVHKLVTTGPTLVSSPALLTFNLAGGGPAPASQTLNITSSGPALSFTAAASTSSGGNWLAVSQPSGNTPAALTVSLSQTNLPAGIYQGAITLTSSSAPTASIGVTLTVTGAGAPVISSGGIVNATGYQNKLAPDTVFVIFGSGLGPATLAAASAPNYPTVLSGTSVTFTPTAGGAAVSAAIVYTVAGQVAALLPSSITPGTYAVRVTYNGLTSSPQNLTVVARSFGIATANSAGSGTVQATIGNINGGVSLSRFTAGSVAFNGLNWTLSPVHPGDSLVFWGTGGGADPANDSGGTSGDQTAAGNFRVMVGSRVITPAYAGASSGYPGLWQINFTLPPDMAPDCYASAQVSAGGELSNTVLLPIAAEGQSACSDPQLSASTLAKLDSGGTVTLAALAVVKTTAKTSTGSVTSEAANASFLRYTAAQWAISRSGPKFGPCQVYDRTYARDTADPGTPTAFLDAGARLAFSGPGVAQNAAAGPTSTPLGPIYLLNLSAGTVQGGKYRMTGTGGSQIGPFTAMTDVPGDFTATNFDSITTVDRSRPLQFTWSGTGLDMVTILVTSSVTSATNVHIATITCTVPAAPGSFPVPTEALRYLPVTSNAGAISIQATSGTPFNVSLTGGEPVDLAVFGPSIGASKSIGVQ